MIRFQKYILVFLLGVIAVLFYSSFDFKSETTYHQFYKSQIYQFINSQEFAYKTLKNGNSILNKNTQISNLEKARLDLKKVDFWLRYLEPLAYKKINAPLPVEWETEVFEKYEKPYKREGSGLTLARLYLDEDVVQKDTLLAYYEQSISASQVFINDSILAKMQSHDHFYLCNRLFLLNVASIYSTGFECPDTSQVIPELQVMLQAVKQIYDVYQVSFPDYKLTQNYLNKYDSLLYFIQNQPKNYSQFDHFTMIQKYINPLYQIQQELILKYEVRSKSYVDFSINKSAKNIFDKNLYFAQNSKGIFIRVKDSLVLKQINDLGKLLFYDPILSGNNKRSCASCHVQGQYFTQNTEGNSLHYNGKDRLQRNTPSLLNSPMNHLLMVDGKHFTLQQQAVAVMTNPDEMGGKEEDVLKKVLSCKEYAKKFKELLKYTPQEKELTMKHIASVLTFYYSKFSKSSATFDQYFYVQKPVDELVKKGFNLYMSKAQCATCHFVPQFNGVKPPYVSSEFEVLGTPSDTSYKQLSNDLGRYNVHNVPEMHRAYKTSTLRNSAHTAPYMHNGVFQNLDQVIEFYNGGGGAGRGLVVDNQTLSADSLKLSVQDKKHLKKFLESLTEEYVSEPLPQALPVSSLKELNNRKIGGEY